MTAQHEVGCVPRRACREPGCTARASFFLACNESNLSGAYCREHARALRDVEIRRAGVAAVERALFPTVPDAI